MLYEDACCAQGGGEEEVRVMKVCRRGSLGSQAYKESWVEEAFVKERVASLSLELTFETHAAAVLETDQARWTSSRQFEAIPGA